MGFFQHADSEIKFLLGSAVIVFWTLILPILPILDAHSVFSRRLFRLLWSAYSAFFRVPELPSSTPDKWHSNSSSGSPVHSTIVRQLLPSEALTSFRGETRWLGQMGSKTKERGKKEEKEWIEDRSLPLFGRSLWCCRAWVGARFYSELPMLPPKICAILCTVDVRAVHR